MKIGILILALLLASINGSRADTITLNAAESGFYLQDASHNAGNYAVGWYTGSIPDNVEVRDYFIFDLAPVSGTVVSAFLRLSTAPPGSIVYGSSDPSETYTLFDVSTDLGPLTDGSAGLAAFDDLGTGVSYGGVTVTPALGATVDVPLNAAGIAFIASNHGRIAIGGAITTLAKGNTSEFLFNSTSALLTRQLVIITSAPSRQGLWWNAPPGSEAGWGINFAHQGDTIFATWFTYDASGKPLWLAVQADKTGPGVYAGNLFTTTGPPFDAVPFDPAVVAENTVGTAVLTFADDNNATFAYTVDIGSPAKSVVAQTKSITRQQFGTLPTCVWGAQPDLTLATNYQDLWWKKPAASEAGWGINFTHQGDTIFATWFTYGASGKPWWLAFVANRTAPGVYTGDIFTTTGPPFNASPFDPSLVVETTVGTATLTFTDGNNATFDYTVNGESQSKAITRQVFAAPGTVCQ